jgi:cytochrome c oxidase cbb3-type subunit 4
MNQAMMSSFWGELIGAIAVILMLIFIGIWIWAWRKRHYGTFKRMSEIPMEDKPEGPAPGAANDTHTEDEQP